MLKPDRRTLMTMALGLCAGAALPRAAGAQTAQPSDGPTAANGAENALPAAAPMHIGRVGLRARDAEALARWYETTLGLQRLPGPSAQIPLGVDSRPLLEIREEAGLRAGSAFSSGLYHTAFLLPDRRALARWLLMAIDMRLPVDGVADHLVSEAVYLTDPEGNGVEIYCDRPETGWRWSGDQIEMGTEPLDVQGLVELVGMVPDLWRTAPAGTLVGHVHLKVGAAAQAGKWWQEAGFDAVRSRDGAVFLSTGRYHHHIAVNEWQSAGASALAKGEAGLDHIEILNHLHSSPAEREDPWGTRILFTPLPA